MSEIPFISVIITAFNRKEFLPRAIESVTNQTLDKSEYELIMVKNFADEKIDSTLESVGAKSIIRGDECVGSYIAEAIELSSGQILVFLDDDDEFERNRLQIIYDLFKKYEEIGYFHNDRVIIDSRGELLQGSTAFRRPETQKLQELGSFRVVSPLSEGDASRLYIVSASSYMSSIAIRRSVLAPFLKFLRSIESAQDYFMFYSALISSCDLAILSSRLTKYRLHKTNASVFRYKSKMEMSFQDAYRKHMIREMSSLSLILSMADELRAERLVKRLILHDFWKRKVNYNLVDAKSSRRMVLSDSLKYLPYRVPAPFSYHCVLLLRALIFLFFPNYESRSFAANRTKN